MADKVIELTDVNKIINKPKHRTITLTNRAPIQIVDDDWPIIAEGKDEWEHPCYDGSGWDIEIRVRRGPHPLGYIIYAYYNYCNVDKEDGQRVRVGRKIDAHQAANKLWEHMVEVGEELRLRIESEPCQKRVTFAMDACFASLKPQTW